ncbi:MAG: helix-turn-helix domain-containing protein [Planctomycetota bacterium]
MSSPTVITLSLSADDRRELIADLLTELEPIIARQASPRLVDADELARLLSLSRPTIDRLRAANVIPSIGDGRMRRYDPDAVIAALSAHKKEADHDA